MPHTLRLALDVPEADRVHLRYAVDELLRPLGLSVEMTQRDSLREGDLYVGERETPAVRLRREDLKAVFGWLSGAREEAVTERDRWGRVRLASMPEQNPLATPVDDIRRDLAQTLRGHGHEVRETTWEGRDWAVALTHDLDALHTPRLRALVGDTLRGQPARGLRRAFGTDDRQRSARALADLAERHGATATFFAKAGTSGPEDVRARPERERAWYRDLLSRGHEIGLHPSVQAATDRARLGAEADRLARVTGTRQSLVRSHFLRWDPAVTPFLYAEAGFEADSTLGWAEAPGFRRGTAHPFRLWDRRVNATSGLWELPLAVMDTTLFVYQRLTDEEVASALEAVFEAARSARGVAVVLWHNAMDGDSAWWERLALLDRALVTARQDGASLLPLGRTLLTARSWS
ncbi:MAG: polysaccharide deacetylase family protein [Bacteroidota bacterium]